MGRDDGVVRNYNGIGGRISSDNTAPIRRSASVVDAIVGETADGGNDSRDEKTERSDHESLLRACDLPRRISCSG